MGSKVLLKEDLPRGVWKMGKITELTKTKKVLKRPLNLLYPLECGSGQEFETTQDGEQSKGLATREKKRVLEGENG